ncbi:hypothetical protein N656DRAFT_79623 [Canariomyces notabilis]|uniref:Uncharacterized protein n=1 Tax=Canariomyces notabilis TaxID=2074819 RepID=A0AAN6YT73_9PEZI|nr:hypothetical protein N656DRAFT_79623 [Canariomyces arenarius]
MPKVIIIEQHGDLAQRLEIGPPWWWNDRIITVDFNQDDEQSISIPTLSYNLVESIVVFGSFLPSPSNSCFVRRLGM